MDDLWEFSFLIPTSDLNEGAVVALVLVALALRILPSTRRWAPRGRVRHARSAPGGLAERAPLRDLNPASDGARDVRRVAPRSLTRA